MVFIKNYILEVLYESISQLVDLISNGDRILKCE